MRLENDTLRTNNICELNHMFEMLMAIKEFTRDLPYNKCTIMSINDYSYINTGRIDIELLLENVDEENKSITGHRVQKVFYVEGRVIDCNTYRETYLDTKQGPTYRIFLKDADSVTYTGKWTCNMEEANLLCEKFNSKIKSNDSEYVYI